MRLSLLAALFVLLAVVYVDAQLPKLTLKQQKILKARGERCLNRYLPKNNPQSAAIKSHLQTCFNVDCGNEVIHRVQGAFPALVPQLRTCIGG